MCDQIHAFYAYRSLISARLDIAMAKETESLDLDPSTVFQGVDAVLKDQNKGEYWIAESDGIAVACLLLIPEWSDWRCATVLWIHSVYVIPKFRRSGIFGKLYTMIKKNIEADDGFAGLRLFVDRSNVIAQKSYTRLGMSSDHYLLFEWLKSPSN